MYSAVGDTMSPICFLMEASNSLSQHRQTCEIFSCQHFPRLQLCALRVSHSGLLANLPSAAAAFGPLCFRFLEAVFSAQNRIHFLPVINSSVPGSRVNDLSTITAVLSPVVKAHPVFPFAGILIMGLIAFLFVWMGEFTTQPH